MKDLFAGRDHAGTHRNWKERYLLEVSDLENTREHMDETAVKKAGGWQ